MRRYAVCNTASVGHGRESQVTNLHQITSAENNKILKVHILVHVVEFLSPVPFESLSFPTNSFPLRHFFAETADGLGWNDPVRLQRTGRYFGDCGPGWKGRNEAKSSEIIQKSTSRDDKMKRYLRLVSQQAAKWVSLRKCQTPVPWNGKQAFSLWQVVSRCRPARDVLRRNRTSRSQGQQKKLKMYKEAFWQPDWILTLLQYIESMIDIESKQGIW